MIGFKKAAENAQELIQFMKDEAIHGQNSCVMSDLLQIDDMQGVDAFMAGLELLADMKISEKNS